MGLSFPSWLLPFLCGILIGAVLASKDFRTKFFISIRSFLSKTNKSTSQQNQRTSEDLKRMHDGLYGGKQNPPKGRPREDEDKKKEDDDDDRDWW